MLYKIFGAALVVASCGSVGFCMAAQHRAEERSLRNLTNILEFMECELRYKLTPLPELCRQVAAAFPQVPGSFFAELSTVIDSQTTPDMESCVREAISANRNLPEATRKILEDLGKTIGRFDLEGQLKGLFAVHNECKRNLDLLENDRESRLRSYQTLGLCAGAALAILLI